MSGLVVFEAAPRQAEGLAALRSGRDAQVDFAIQRRNGDGGAERGFVEGDGDFDANIEAVAFPERVGRHADAQKQVAVWPAARTRCAASGDFHRRAVGNQGRDFHRHVAQFLTAIAALNPQLHALLRAPDRFGEGDVERVFDVAALLRAARALTAKTAQHFAKQTPDAARPARLIPADIHPRLPPAALRLRDDVFEIQTPRHPAAAEVLARKAAPLRPMLRVAGRDFVEVFAELVVELALFGVSENLVRRANFLEFRFGVRVVRVHVRVIFARQLPDRHP